MPAIAGICVFQQRQSLDVIRIVFEDQLVGFLKHLSSSNRAMARNDFGRRQCFKLTHSRTPGLYVSISEVAQTMVMQDASLRPCKQH